jgi:hypothetical protein
MGGWYVPKVLPSEFRKRGLATSGPQLFVAGVESSLARGNTEQGSLMADK